jgi:dUTPase
MDAAPPESCVSAEPAAAAVAAVLECEAAAAAAADTQPSGAAAAAAAVATAVRFITIHPKAYFPNRRSDKAAGYDLRAFKTTTIPPHSKDEILTELLLYLPPGNLAYVSPCSDWGFADRLDVVSDVLDASFWKNLGVVFWNHTQSPLRIPRGSVIGQIVLQKHEKPKTNFCNLYIHTWYLISVLCTLHYVCE